MMNPLTWFTLTSEPPRYEHWKPSPNNRGYCGIWWEHWLSLQKVPINSPVRLWTPSRLERLRSFAFHKICVLTWMNPNWSAPQGLWQHPQPRVLSLVPLCEIALQPPCLWPRLNIGNTQLTVLVKPSIFFLYTAKQAVFLRSRNSSLLVTQGCSTTVDLIRFNVQDLYFW